MPGRYFLTAPLTEVAGEFGCDVNGVPDPGPRLDASPGEMVAAVVAEKGLKLSEMRWGMMPMGVRDGRGRPVMKPLINARSETVFEKPAFANARRCILPVNGWYEWTGEKRRKQRWAITAPEWELMGFAAVWDVWQGPGGTEVRSMATLTCEPNGDVAAIHHRMPVILPPPARKAWLESPWEEAAAVLRTLENGRLRIEKVPEPPKDDGQPSLF